MPRPSRNLDRVLLAAGRELLPHRGCGGLTVREVAEAAGVNLGMFHYHFKSREAFLRELLQSMYEDMYAQLAQHAGAMPAGAGDTRALEVLRGALGFMGRFVRANRPVLSRVLADALCGDPIAAEFLAKNMPRHLGLLLAIVEAGRKDGSIRALPAPQVLGFCAGSLAMPILFGGALAASGALGREQTKMIEDVLLSDRALDERIDLALAAISNLSKHAGPKARPRSPRGRK